ncbi:MAG: hypothetical protein K9J17_10835 [Flavobacteriales bacterium]|nr:hypothetical protein [Flavobacteriales bacterium]
MKQLFTLITLVCFSFGMANAQNASEKTTTSTRVKMESKESLKKVEGQPKKVEAAKIDKRVATVKRVDAANTSKAVMTEEQMKARAAEKAATAEPKVKKTGDK